MTTICRPTLPMTDGQDPATQATHRVNLGVYLYLDDDTPAVAGGGAVANRAKK